MIGVRDASKSAQSFNGKRENINFFGADEFATNQICKIHKRFISYHLSRMGHLSGPDQWGHVCKLYFDSCVPSVEMMGIDAVSDCECEYRDMFTRPMNAS